IYGRTEIIQLYYSRFPYAKLSIRCNPFFSSVYSLILSIGCFAVAYFVDNRVELYVIGSARATFLLNDGSLCTIKDEHLVKLNEIKIEAIHAEAFEQKASFKKILLSLYEKQKGHLSITENEDELPFFTSSSRPQFRFIHRSFDVSSIKSIYLYSDGLAQSYEYLKLYEDENAMFNSNVDLSNIASDVVKVWNKDKDLVNYPRLKIKDDISILKLDIKH
ncbi:MAG: hypothetical protein HUJ61_02495, partial [Bacilli bacterium]|nr:hypothetical protein [Bacilli bacterium]